MTETYAAWWPVLDDDRTLTELATEARPDLDELAADVGRIIAGDVQWSTAERVGVGLVLMAVAPVEAVDVDRTEPTRIRSGGRPAADVIEDVEWLLDADPALTPHNVADRLGVTPEAIHRALKRGGRADLSVRLTQNHERRNGHLTGRRSA